MRGILRCATVLAAVLTTGDWNVSRAEPGDVLLTVTKPPGVGGWGGGPLLGIGDNLVVPGIAFDVFDGKTGDHRYQLRNPLGWPLLAYDQEVLTGEFDYFGRSVAKSDDGLLLVGASNQSNVLPYGGSAFLYDVEGGDLLQTFLDPSTNPGSRFGESVAFVGGMVAIAAPFENGYFQIDAGAVHLFDPVTGGLVRTLENPRQGMLGSFGRSIASSGDLLLVGDGEGAAFLFDVASSEPLHAFTDPSYTSGRFGWSVAFADGVAVVGAPWYGHSESEWQTGAIYTFDTDSGDLLGMLEEPTRGVRNRFGLAMVAEEDSLLVGVFDADLDGEDTGAAYLYDLPSLELRQVFSNPFGDGNSFGGNIGFLGPNVAITSMPHGGSLANPRMVHVFETVPEPGTIALLLSAAFAAIVLRGRLCRTGAKSV